MAKIERDKIRVYHVEMTMDVNMVANNPQELMRQAITAGAKLIHRMDDITDTENGQIFLDNMFKANDGIENNDMESDRNPFANQPAEV